MSVAKFIKEYEKMNNETQEITKNQIMEYLTKKDNFELFKKIKIYINNTIKSSIKDIINNDIEINDTHEDIKHSNKKNIIKYIIKILNELNIDMPNVFEILNNNTLYELRQKKIILQLIKTEMNDFEFTYNVKQLYYLIEINFTILFKNFEYIFKYLGDVSDCDGKGDEYIFKENFNNEYKYIIEQIFILDYEFEKCCEWSREYKKYDVKSPIF
jgi:hypothetical protein